MNRTTRRARRISIAAGAACAAIAIPAAALAAPARPAASTGAAPPRCTVSQLRDWIGIPGSAAAGSAYYQLELSDISARACTLQGYPGVSAYGSGLKQIGRAARRNPSNPVRLVTLRPGGTAHVVLVVGNVDNYPPSACHPALAQGLRVYAPNDFTAQTISFPVRVCRGHGPAVLGVSTAIAGTGIPGAAGIS